MGTVSRRKRVRDGGERDVEAVLDELYITPPADFVARREELAAAAKAAGHADDARRIHAAHRPTLAAWAANLLLRSQPEESRRFLELGHALREAYRTLDAAGINELSEQRRRIVTALSRQTARLAEEAGHRLSDPVQQDVESTLRAVLTDPDAAERWAGGRLEGAHPAVGLSRYCRADRRSAEAAPRDGSGAVGSDAGEGRPRRAAPPEAGAARSRPDGGRRGRAAVAGRAYRTGRR